MPSGFGRQVQGHEAVVSALALLLLLLLLLMPPARWC